jgi:hypothetical protein
VASKKPPPYVDGIEPRVTGEARLDVLLGREDA